MWKAVSEVNVKGEDMTLGVKLGKLDPPAPVVPATLEVKSVTAVNFGEIDVVFNNAINEDSVSKSKILINGVALGTTDSAVVLEDGVTLRLTRPEPGFVTAQNVARRLSISDVTSSVGSVVMTAVKDREVIFSDKTLPELLSVEAVGNKRVVLNFSEPIKNTIDARIFANYKIDDKFVVGTGTPTVSGRTITIDLSAVLAAGTHKLTTASQKFEDYAG